MSDAVLSQFKQATTEEKVYDTNHKFKIAIIGTGWIETSIKPLFYHTNYIFLPIACQETFFV